MSMHAGGLGNAVSVSSAAFPLLATNGTAGAPSYSFGSDTDSGIILADDGLLAFVTAGGVRAYLSSTAIFPNAVYVDSSNQDVRLTRDANGSAILRSTTMQTAFGTAALNTNATIGFPCMQSTAGVPTGTPANIPTGQVPYLVNSITGQMFAYTGGAWVGMPRVLAINSTAVGNINAGTDDLITFNIAANTFTINNKTIRVRAWGTTANNANAKQLTFNVGSQVVVNTALTTSIAGQWEVEALIIRTGANTQDIVARTLQGATLIFDQELTAGTQNETAAITIKCTGTATATDDIKQEGMVTEIVN